MQGNLLEWVHDWYDSVEGGSVVVDPQGPVSGRDRVLRGGSWGLVAAYCRAAYRNSLAPANRGANIGFRLALSPSVNKPPEAEKEQEQRKE
jgi:formylglycine-generating enzyme required for sulfatase activity